jgi:hypothetical protein
MAGEPRDLAVFREHIPPPVATLIVGSVPAARYENASAMASRAAALLASLDGLHGARRGRVGSVPKERELAEQISLAEDQHEAVLAASPRADLDPAGVNEECFAARVVALAEDDLPGIERSGGDGTDATAQWMIPLARPGLDD